MRQRVHGFTLLEVIAAIAILALSAAILMKVLGASMTLTRKAAARTQAVAWAQSLLDSAFVMQPPVPGVTQGRFDKTYRWRLTVQPWQPLHTQASHVATETGNSLQLYKLNLAVTWGPPARTHVAHFDTLRVVHSRAAETGP